MSNTPLLSVKGLSSPLFGPVDLELDRNTRIAVLGESGAGKSLFLRALVDLDLNQGEVHLDGRPRHSFPPGEWRRRVALLPAEPRWWRATVGEHFAAPDAVVQWFDALGLSREALNWSVARLSSGERQRLALLRMLANRPEVLLLDEPTANVDRSNRGRVETLVRNYCKERGAGVLWVTHDLDQARRIAERHWLMDGGLLRGLAEGESWTPSA